MRFRSTLILVGLTSLVIGGLLLAGCSSDDKTTPRSTVSLTQLMLPAATSQVNVQLDSMIARLDAGLTVSTIVEDGNAFDIMLGSGLADTVTRDDGWLIIVLTDLQSSLGALTVVDSIQYLKNGQTQSTPRDADEVIFRHFYSRTAGDTTVTSKDLVTQSDLTFAGTSTSQATIDGTISSVIHDKTVTTDSTVWQDWDIEAVVSALRVGKAGQSWGEGCPITGTAQISVDFTYQKNNSAAVTTSWDFAVMFTNGAITVNITSGPDFSSNYQHTVCNP